MIYRIFLFVIPSLMFCCHQHEKMGVPKKFESKLYYSYGKYFEPNHIISMSDFEKNGIEVMDTLNLILRGNIDEVCKKKGCWMKLKMSDNKKMMVKFKDYGFFIPSKSKGEVIVKGRVFNSELSVKELQHYAEDSGASDFEIRKINKSKRIYSFEADGVLILN